MAKNWHLYIKVDTKNTKKRPIYEVKLFYVTRCDHNLLYIDSILKHFKTFNVKWTSGTCTSMSLTFHHQHLYFLDRKKNRQQCNFFLMAMHTHTLTHICVVGGFHSFIDLFVGQQDSPFPVRIRVDTLKNNVHINLKWPKVCYSSVYLQH